MNDLLTGIQNAMKDLLKVETRCLNTCRSKGSKADGGAFYDGKCLCIQYVLKLKHKFTFKVKFHTLSSIHIAGSSGEVSNYLYSR